MPVAQTAGLARWSGVVGRHLGEPGEQRGGGVRGRRPALSVVERVRAGQFAVIHRPQDGQADSEIIEWHGHQLLGIGSFDIGTWADDLPAG